MQRTQSASVLVSRWTRPSSKPTYHAVSSEPGFAVQKRSAGVSGKAAWSIDGTQK
jgi:hypothetical protein